ncbi:alpha-mannosidase 2-like [Achroia grisella]|uniref:alpha-mannosidase 2-like n=1 Tax=Achroia grisella TaxID=688607 RepID=UPI0027D20F5E|nr:alpha-mannosidase 2-like [Achroia grisella]
MRSLYQLLCVFTLNIVLNSKIYCYEKTLRKIVRNQSKMIQRPFSDTGTENMVWRNASLFPMSLQFNRELMFKMQRPKVSTILSVAETNHGKSYSRMKTSNEEYLLSNEQRLTRNTLYKNISSFHSSNSYLPIFNNSIMNSNTFPKDIAIFYQIPTRSKYFPTADDNLQNYEQKGNNKESGIVIPEFPQTNKDNESVITKSIFKSPIDHKLKTIKPDYQDTSQHEVGIDKADFLIEELIADPKSKYSYNVSDDSYTCTVLQETKANIDAQETFSNFDIEPLWMANKHFWNSIYDSRYEYLMRNHKWPALKVILVPRTHVDTIWKQSFEYYHNNSVNKIISNVVKKLQFYDNLTFTWNEVSHLSQWWKTASQKSRSVFRRLIKGGRLEITTGGWVEPDEATTHIFGLIHQLTEGHQWLKCYLNYMPKVGWLTNSVTHSPTMAYLLTASGISNLVMTNLHFSWEQYLAEYQYSDFVWIQNWDNDKTSATDINDALNRLGNDRLPKHSVLTHYLQFNSAGFKACGPNKAICSSDFNFGKPNRNFDINPYNVKEKAELLLEQYSKTGTITPHNIMMAPLGGPYAYESQSEFDYQYMNYQTLAEFINANSNIYKATVQFGTPSDYFNNIVAKHKNYPTLKGDFLNFADIHSGSPAYWAGFYTSRPLLKVLLRRLQSTLRTTEILFTFTISMNAFHGFNTTEIFKLLIKSRESVARLLDKNVVSGTVNANTLRYVHNQIIMTAKDCWYIQEVSASLLSIKPDQIAPYLQKYIYRDGEFVSVFRTVAAGDQVYVFNSLSHERTEIVELITKTPNIRIVDHNKKHITIQINPVWKYNSKNIVKISRTFFKIVFVIHIPPMTLELFRVKETYDTTQSTATIYCQTCKLDDDYGQNPYFKFNIQSIQPGDIQFENYKHRLIFDEVSGFLKTVIEKSNNKEKMVVFDYGAFKSSDHNAGMFLFNTDVRRPLQDILMPYRTGYNTKLLMITSGQVTTELISIYGLFLQHTVKIFNLLKGPLSDAIYLESKVNYEVAPKNRELELFLSIQTDISNGNYPEIYTDNNGFQYTKRVLNITRRIESNMYPITNMVYIQDSNKRLTLITDHAQGVTALQEGQLVVMLDRRILFNDGRGTHEGLADNTVTYHRHIILLENFAESVNYFGYLSFENHLKLPSQTALNLANSINYPLDIFVNSKKNSNLSYYAFIPLIKTSFPCDVSVVNYRTILNRGVHNQTPNSALLVLFRQTASCRIDNTDLHCNGESGFTVDNILRSVKSVYLTNLVGTSDGVPQTFYNLRNFPPMELITLRIYF